MKIGTKLSSQRSHKLTDTNFRSRIVANFIYKSRIKVKVKNSLTSTSKQTEERDCKLYIILK